MSSIGRHPGNFLETYGRFFLAESAGGTLAEIPESTLGTLFLADILIVLGPLEIFAEKVYPECFQEFTQECLR